MTIAKISRRVQEELFHSIFFHIQRVEGSRQDTLLNSTSKKLLRLRQGWELES